MKTHFDLSAARQHFKTSGKDMSEGDETYYKEGWSKFDTEWRKPNDVGCDFHLAESLMYSGLLERRENHSKGYQAWFRIPQP